ncbi:MAG TPA: preprotein translocase subunit SecA [Bacteroidales bacterium]|jgi:preprotein translocase subunit SecA|nr:preprotein translocase subunit SecA [Bacteroidales bacterium]
MGISSILKKFFKTKSEKDVAEILPVVEKILAVYNTLRNLSNDELRERSNALKIKVRSYFAEDEAEIEQLKATAESDEISVEEKTKIYEKIDKLTKEVNRKIEEILLEVLPEAFAIVKETARRFVEDKELVVTANDFDRNLAAYKSNVVIEGNRAVWKNKWIAGGNEIEWDMIHYDVQLIGGYVLHQGKIAEMATGEGKTLVATLPVFLNALAGKGVHIVTVNDYLAKRDSEWMGPLYEFHGLSVDCIDKHQPNSTARRNAYLADITFGTNNEYGFDYLRDNMAISPDDLVQRTHHYAIVDEVDSVLIDDARTPLIISGPVPKGEDQLFMELRPKVEKIYNAQKNLVNEILNQAKKLIQSGDTEKGGILLLRSFKGLPKNKALIKFLSEQGMKTLLHKTENTFMQDNSKRMPEITEELYFVIDEKQNTVELTDKGIDFITSSSDDPKMFVLPDIGSRIAEIEKSNLNDNEKLKAKDDLLRDYAVKSERVHTINQLLKAYTMFEKDVEYVVMNNEVKIVDEQTGRILEGRRYSDGLHQAIEAKENVKVEAATQTFATITLQNYFRMYHKLAGMTGTAETEAGELWNIYKLDVVVIPTNKPVIRKDMEDKVYKTKREKYNAVIEEIVQLTQQGRPVLVGTTSVEISELLSRMLKLRGIKHNVLNAKQHQREAEIVAEAGKTSSVTIATNMAGRGTDIKLSEDVRKAGGLAIIGTERHESRRVDRQLRGRAGRQGDPGSSQFYVSLEDDLMRLFGSDRIARMMDRLGIKEGEVIQHSMITKSIERAQKKVEENNFGIRKRLLEYDDVMNVQREVIYRRRRNALFGEKLQVDIAETFKNVCNAIVFDNYGEDNYEAYSLDVIKYLGIQNPVTNEEYVQLSEENQAEILYKHTIEHYHQKCQQMIQLALPIITDVYKTSGQVYQNIIVPISDGLKTYQVITHLKKAVESEGKEIIRAFEKTAILATIDEAWKEHLREMDELKQSVQNAVYEQKDPLLIYKFEATELFKTMQDLANREIVALLTKGFIPMQDPNEVKEAKAPQKTDLSKLKTGREDVASPGSNINPEERKAEPVRVEKKIGRNDPCPCGSGKKYKHCHGKNVTVD